MCSSPKTPPRTADTTSIAIAGVRSRLPGRNKSYSTKKSVSEISLCSSPRHSRAYYLDEFASYRLDCCGNHQFAGVIRGVRSSRECRMMLNECRDRVSYFLAQIKWFDSCARYRATTLLLNRPHQSRYSSQMHLQTLFLHAPFILHTFHNTTNTPLPLTSSVNIPLPVKLKLIAQSNSQIQAINTRTSLLFPFQLQYTYVAVCWNNTEKISMAPAQG